MSDAQGEARWVGPVAWALFLGGFALAIAGVVPTTNPGGEASGVLLGAGIVAVLVGLITLAATGRVMPGRR